MARFKAEQQLILLSAGTVERRREMAVHAQQLAGEVEWLRLAQSLASRRLLTVLGPRILELADGRATGPFESAVRDAIKTGRRHGAFLQLVALRITAMLADAGIPSTTLKGPLFGEAIYGDPGRRLSTDIDLLVSPKHLRAAADVVRELGYGAPSDYVQDCGLPLLHFVLVHDRGQLPPVELHWRVHWYENRFARERLLPPELGSLHAWRPALVDELASLLLFYARDGFIDLRLATDLSAWWDLYGDALPSGALQGLLNSYPALARVIRAAVDVSEKTVGLPSERVLGARRELGVRGRVAGRLANPNPNSSRSQLYADIGLIDGLLMPPGGFRSFVRRQLLPPPEVLVQHARHGARERPRSPLSRSVGVLGRYGLAMARLARAPETL